MSSPLRYFLAEAATSMNRSRGVSLLAVGTIAIALTILGAFLYLSGNVSSVVARWRQEVQVNLYLLDGLEPETLRALEGRLRRDPAVEQVAYISKEEALARFRSYFAEMEDLARTLEVNPLPASFEVRLIPHHRSPEAVRRFATSLASLDGVEEVQYDTGWVRRLHSLVQLTSGAGYLLGGILLAAAMFTTSNVIRLAMFSRRDEVEILQLVGATRGFIQGPYVAEGMLQGLLGGLVAVLVLGGAHQTLNAYESTSGPFLRLMTAHFLGAWAVLGVVGVGAVMGLVGSLFAVRKFLGRDP